MGFNFEKKLFTCSCDLCGTIEAIGFQGQAFCGHQNSSSRLMQAVQSGNLRKVSRLAGKVDLMRLVEGKNFLVMACKNGSLSLVKILLDQGAMDSEDAWGMNPLIAAVRAGHAEIVATLLSRGFKIRSVINNHSAFRDATLFGRREILQLLIEGGGPLHEIERCVFCENDMFTLLKSAGLLRHKEKQIFMAGRQLFPLKDWSRHCIRQSISAATNIVAAVLHLPLPKSLREFVKMFPFSTPVDQGKNTHLRFT